jgi:PAS domain S-box-containing protein
MAAASQSDGASKSLLILQIEDNHADAELALLELSSAGFEVSADVVDTLADVASHLAAKSYDVVLADYRLPGWVGTDALQIVKQHQADIPFILVSGTLGEETAVECVKNGVTDFVLKDHLARLPNAVRRALREKSMSEEHQRAEKALTESEERLRTIVELAPEGIFVISEQGQFLQVNQAACDQLGYTREQLFQLKLSDIVALRFAQRFANRLRGEAPSGSYESAHIRADGIEVPVELSVAKIMFRGQPAFLGIARDISNRKRYEEERTALEQQLRQAQKMEAVGKLAGGIAHDFNNILMVIQSYTEMLQDQIPAHDALRRNTQQIMKASARAASLTRQMLAFSRKQILSPVVLGLNAAIDDTAKMLKRLIGEDIEFRVNPTESLWTIKADPDQFVQVLMNLCVNARDAMPQGGTLTIATANVTVEECGIGGRPYVLPGDYVRLSVTDSGVGISKALQDQIFEPFFTTKEVGKGTGLGLSTVYGIVKQSDGYLWVDSELGQGACFTIYLPRVKQAIASNIPTEAEAPLRGTMETILVAEDEESLREAVCDYLSCLGYTVLAAGSGSEALSAASEHEGNITLLITDVVMPVMSGRELSQMMESRYPKLKTIFMSGYTDDLVLRHGIHQQDATFLQKPFALGTLARKVRDTLDRTEIVQ